MAGGFMSGFGPAFSSAFNQTRAMNAEKEQDNFRLMYQDYLEKRKETEALDRENNTNIRKAKSLASTYAGGEQNWLPIYRMVSSGRDDSEIVEFLKNNEMEIAPSTEGSNEVSADNQDLSSSAQGAVDAQMQESGMTPPPTGGIFGKIKGVFDPIQRADRQANRSINRMSEVTGESPEDIKKVMAGNTGTDGGATQMDGFNVTWKPKKAPVEPPKLWDINTTEEAITAQEYYKRFGTPQERQIADTLYERNLELERNKSANAARAKAEAEGTAYVARGAALRDKNDNFVRSLIKKVDGQGNEFWFDPVTGKEADPAGGRVEVFSKQMQEDIDQQAKDYAKDVGDYNNGIETLKSSTRLSSDIIKLANEQPEALHISGDVAQIINSVSRNYTNIKALLFNDLRDNRLNDNASPARINAIERAETEIKSALHQTLDNTEIVALKAGLLDVMATKLAYMHAAALGQNGRSVTNEEFNNFKAAIMGGGNAGTITEALAKNINEQYMSMKDREVSINDASTAMRAFEQKWRMPSPFKPAMPVDEMIQNDDQFRSTFEQLTQGPSNINNAPQPVEPNLPAPPGISPEDWKYMSEEDRKLWLN